MADVTDQTDSQSAIESYLLDNVGPYRLASRGMGRMDAGWELTAGQAFGEYRIGRPLGRGGMGAVYEAEQISLERIVALKVITPELSSDPDFLEMFREEARLAAALDHPNVLPIYHAGAGHDGRLFVAMRLAPGGDLAEHLHRVGRLDPTEALQILAQVAAALDAAHDAGMVHRDVKPANVLLEQRDGVRQAYLSDFGLARRLTDARGDSGRAAGTAEYMAPEQIEGGEVDRRADVYAFGCLLHRCLTGTVPYRRETREQVLVAHLNAPLPRPGAIVDGVPPVLDAIVRAALQKDPAHRPTSAKRLIDRASAELGVRRVPTRSEPREQTRITVPARPPVQRPVVHSPRPSAQSRGGGRAGWIAAAAITALVAATGAVAVPALLAERDRNRAEDVSVTRSLAGLRLSAQAARGATGLATALPSIAPADDGTADPHQPLARVSDDMTEIAANVRRELPPRDRLRRLLLRATSHSADTARALGDVAGDPYGPSAAAEVAAARSSFSNALAALHETTGESRRRLEGAGRLSAGDTSLINAISADLVRAGEAVDDGFSALEQRLGV